MKYDIVGTSNNVVESVYIPGTQGPILMMMNSIMIIKTMRANSNWEKQLHTPWQTGNGHGGVVLYACCGS